MGLLSGSPSIRSKEDIYNSAVRRVKERQARRHKHLEPKSYYQLGLATTTAGNSSKPTASLTAYVSSSTKSKSRRQGSVRDADDVGEDESILSGLLSILEQEKSYDLCSTIAEQEKGY